jgi:hypothetical protein
MNFFSLIQSLDEMLYQAASWLLFYPITLWRMISAPLKTMKAAERELSESEAKQFDDVVAPPLFLLLSILVVHTIELGTVGENGIVASTRGLSRLISGDTSLIIFRIFMFSILPLAASAQLIQARGARIDARALKGPFYAQCYAAGIFVLLSDGLALLIERHLSFEDPHYYAILAASLIWLLVVEARWFVAELGCSLMKGFGLAATMIVQWVLLFIPVVYLLD